MNEREQQVREQLAEAAHQSIEKGDFTGWFEELYKNANGDMEAIPWLDLKPNRFLVEWDEERLSEGKGRSALVVGCGLGDEAKYLVERNWNVTAFDISETAIEWAKKVNDGLEIEFHVADLFELPDELQKTWDLVVEVYTIQALPVDIRTKTIDAIAALVGEGGQLVVVQRLREKHGEAPDGPPWAVSKRELERLEKNGLTLSEFVILLGDEEEPIQRFVAKYLRS